MTQPVDPGRLTELRKRMGLTQEGLARRAGLRKETVHRLERGRQSGNRQKTVEGLCKALGVDADILSGQKPLVPSERRMDEPADASRYQLNVRLDGDIRNAFSLVVLRYKIPISRIVELAPLLFVLAAEGSLDRRRAKLAELEALFKMQSELTSSFPHLPTSIYPSVRAEEAIQEEQASIKVLDIFGSIIRYEDGFSPVGEDSETGEYDNPFVTYLKEVALEKKNLAEISYFEPYSSTLYRVCQEDASALAGDDEGLAECILEGWIQIHEMPRELLEERASAARTAWMRPKLEELQARRAETDRILEEFSVRADDKED